MQSVSVLDNGVHEHSEKRNEPKWLTEYRLKNAKIFEQKPLKKSMYISVPALEKLLKKPVGKEFSLPVEIEKTGAKVFSWKDALKEIPQKIKDALERECAPKDHFEAFINAWFDSGFVLLANNGASAEKIVFEPVFEKEQIGKILVIIENNEREVKIIETLRGKEVLLLNETVFLGENCAAAFLRIHLHEENSQALLYQQTVLERDSSLQNSNAWLNGKLLRSNTYNHLIGSGSKVKHLDFALLNNAQLFDINNTALHTATGSESFTEIKSVLTDRAKNVFDGMIKILPGGQRTRAMLEAHSMLLSENASSNNIPGLEIEADDVSATHSASVAQILDEQVFYLESRGIKKSIAKQLIVESFLESIIFRLPNEFQSKLVSLVEQKLKSSEKE